MKKFTYKAALILIALSGYIGVNIITPVLSELGANFPGTSPTTLALVVTIPTITMLVGLLISATLSTRVRRKLIIMVGLSIVIIAGIAPYFLHSLTLIIVSRGILGIGMGLLMPIQASYFAEFDSATRSKLFGFNNVINGLLGAMMFMLIGALHLSWRNVFLLYTVFIAVLILMILVLPKGEVLKASSASDSTIDYDFPSGGLLQPKFIFSCVAAVVLMAAYMIIPTTLSFYMEQHQLGGVQEAGNLSAVATICIAFCGFLYPVLRQFCKHQTATVSYLVAIAGFAIYAFPHNQFLLWLGFILASCGPSLVSTDFSMQFTETVSPAKVATASAIFICCTYGGQFLSTYFQSVLINLFGLASVEASYLIIAVILAIFMVLSFFVQRQKNAPATVIILGDSE